MVWENDKGLALPRSPSEKESGEADWRLSESYSTQIVSTGWNCLLLGRWPTWLTHLGGRNVSMWRHKWWDSTGAHDQILVFVEFTWYLSKRDRLKLELLHRTTRTRRRSLRESLSPCLTGSSAGSHLILRPEKEKAHGLHSNFSHPEVNLSCCNAHSFPTLQICKYMRIMVTSHIRSQNTLTPFSWNMVFGSLTHSGEVKVPSENFTSLLHLWED